MMVALGRHAFCRRYATDGPGHLRFVQGFRARLKTFLRLDPVPRSHVISGDWKRVMSTNLYALIIDMAVVTSDFDLSPLVKEKRTAIQRFF